jgi:hypothetical protein
VEGVNLGEVPGRNYRLIVKGELSDKLELAFPGMVLTREEGSTALTCNVGDQAELLGLLQRLSDLGLILLEARAIEERLEAPPRGGPADADRGEASL